MEPETPLLDCPEGVEEFLRTFRAIDNGVSLTTGCAERSTRGYTPVPRQGTKPIRHLRREGPLSLVAGGVNRTMSASKYPHSYHLFSAYFHQDCLEDDDDWPDIIRRYVSDANSAELVATVRELDLLLANTDDAELDHEVFIVLGSDYGPRPDLGGPTTREWLSKIATLLREAAV